MAKSVLGAHEPLLLSSIIRLAAAGSTRTWRLELALHSLGNAAAPWAFVRGNSHDFGRPGRAKSKLITVAQATGPKSVSRRTTRTRYVATRLIDLCARQHRRPGTPTRGRPPRYKAKPGSRCFLRARVGVAVVVANVVVVVATGYANRAARRPPPPVARRTTRAH